MKAFFIALAIPLLVVSSAHALGNGKGNGGFAIACTATSKAPAFIKALDLFEAEDRNLHILSFSTVDEFAIAQQVLQRMSVFSPVRTQNYISELLKFSKYSKLISNAQFVDVNDVGAVYKPNNCEFLPVIAQKRNYFGTGVSYFINQEVWSTLTPINKAALIVHEIIYADFLHDISSWTRSFVGLLFSSEFDFINSYDKFFDLLVRHQAPYAEQNGMFIDLNRPFRRDIVYKNKIMFSDGFS